MNLDALSRVPDEDMISAAILDFDYDYINYLNHTPSLTISSLESNNPSGPTTQGYAPDWNLSLDLLLEQKNDAVLSPIIEEISTHPYPELLYTSARRPDFLCIYITLLIVVS